MIANALIGYALARGVARAVAYPRSTFDVVAEMDRIARTMGMRVRRITEAEFVATLTPALPPFLSSQEGE